MKILITGIAGFIGSHLSDLLVRQDGVFVSGIIRKGVSLDNLSSSFDNLDLFYVDLMNYDDVLDVLKKVKPDVIIHLAAQTSVKESMMNPMVTMRMNIEMQYNILEAVLECELDSLVMIASSAEVYGKVELDELPVKESNKLKPVNPYALSKMNQDLLAWQYYKNHKIDVVTLRQFNISGSRRDSRFVESSFAKQIVEIEKGLVDDNVIRHGNLEAIRDFTHVSDAVNAYWMLIQKRDNIGGEVFNLCYGYGLRIQSILERLVQLSGVDVRLEVDVNRLRMSDVPVVIGDNSKLKYMTGWDVTKTKNDILNDLLDYWRCKLS